MSNTTATMERNKEKWIDDVLNSADSIKKVRADEQLFLNINSRLSDRVQQIKAVPAKTVWLAAASIALLFALNFVLLSRSESGKSSNPGTQQSPYSLNNSFEIY